MNLTLKGLNKKGNTAIYEGTNGSVRITLSSFPDKTAPASFEVPEGLFVAKRQPKPKMTAEERKAARANAPKPTLAERAEKARIRAEKLAAQAAAETQPSL